MAIDDARRSNDGPAETTAQAASDDPPIELAFDEAASRFRAVMCDAFAEYAAFPLPSSALEETDAAVSDALARGGALVVPGESGAPDRAVVRFAVSWSDAPDEAERRRRLQSAWSASRRETRAPRSVEPSRNERCERGDANGDAPGRAVGALSFSRLSVARHARGAGLGRALVRALERLAEALGLQTVTMTARSQQPDNRPYYERLGYRVVGYAPCYGVPDLVTRMEKVLAPPHETDGTSPGPREAKGRGAARG
jgi:GNAT superfamily N-acetyltransferase